MKGVTIALNACGEDGAQRKSASCLTDVNPPAQFRACAPGVEDALSTDDDLELIRALS